MPGESSAVTPDVVRRVAELARLRLPEADVPRWTAQLSRILAYVEQIEDVPEAAAAAEPPAATPLRGDVPAPCEGLEALEANAPKRFRSYGAVPRVVGSAS